MRPAISRLILGLALSVLVGCGSIRQWAHNGLKVGPNYCRPAAPLSEGWTLSEEAPFELGEEDGEFWWRAFGDPVLDRLVHVAYQQNRSLRSAGLRVLEARAQRAVIVGSLFPQSQFGEGSFTNSRSSVNAGTGFPGFPLNRDLWKTGASIAWEIDLWGRFRREIESADANLHANVEDFDHILTTLIADVATTYFQIRAIEQRLDFAQRNIAIQAETLEITQTKQRLGARGATGLEVNQAETNLRTTQALVPQLELTRRTLHNALSVLLGVPPQALDNVLGGAAFPEVPEQVVIDIPADLIRRRPDVRRSERLVAAQSARIGIATAELLPHFSLNGALSLESAQFRDLFESASRAGFVAPGFRWNILNYGRLRNNVRVQEAAFLQRVTDYENVVLQAQRECEDAMAAFLYAGRRVTSLQEATRAAAEAVRLGRLQWEEGKIEYNQIFVLEGTLTQTQDSLASAQLELAQGLVDVYRAIGGGWQIRYHEPHRGFARLEEIAEAAEGEPPTVATPETEREDRE